MTAPIYVSEFRTSGSGPAPHPAGSPYALGGPQNWPSSQAEQRGMSEQLWIVLGVSVAEVGTVYSVEQVAVLAAQGRSRTCKYFVKGSKASDYILVQVRTNDDGSESILRAQLGSEIKPKFLGSKASSKPFIDLGYKWYPDPSFKPDPSFV